MNRRQFDFGRNERNAGSAFDPAADGKRRTENEVKGIDRQTSGPRKKPRTTAATAGGGVPEQTRRSPTTDVPTKHKEF